MTRIKAIKINRVLEFKQSQWLKPYVEFNTKKRIEAEKNGDEDGKVIYKLMGNTVYGKTMENLRNRIDVRLVGNEGDYLKWTSKSSCMQQKIFDNDLVAMRKRKVTLTLTKQANVRIFTLDLSKALMYEFYYDYIKNKYGNNSKLLFTDTGNDSLMYEIKIDDVYEDFSKDKEMFDFSGYSVNSKYYADSNELVVGKMKDQIKWFCY